MSDSKVKVGLVKFRFDCWALGYMDAVFSHKENTEPLSTQIAQIDYDLYTESEIFCYRAGVNSYKPDKDC